MAMAALLVAGSTFAQTEKTDSSSNKVDTVKVGNFIIIKKNKSGGSSSSGGDNSSTSVTIERKPKKISTLSTNWLIFDLGFANIDDRTTYANAGSYLRAVGKENAPTAEDLKLKASKSSNVNIWFVMQKLNLAKGYLNLKYGAGLEMYNFRYDSRVNYDRDDKGAYIFKDSIAFSKNKLYAGYLTVPFMINVNTTPGRKKGLSFSAGISAGYLVGQHDKQISGERGKEKTKGDLGLEQWKLAYVGELGLGPIRLFGSYAMTKLHDKGLEQYPYSFGIRFSNW